MFSMKQTAVYFKKIARIAIREKAWKFVVFAVIIAALVASVVGENMFTTYESTKSGFFTIVSACIWIGILIPSSLFVKNMRLSVLSTGRGCGYLLISLRMWAGNFCCA